LTGRIALPGLPGGDFEAMTAIYTVVPNVLGYLEKDDKVLLGLRKGQPSKIYPNHWDLPGGRIESGESVEKALVREFLEETGLVIMQARLVDAF
jgi:8-oxo-dGTP pyrophosphatase MutT (NUDIX family)